MEVYYVELRKATVLEKKFIYSMCWLFGMELQFGAHTRQHPPPPSPPNHHHHLHPSQSHLPTTPRQALSAGTWGFSKKKKACFQPAETTKMLPLINGVLKLKYRPHRRTGRTSGDVERWSRQEVWRRPFQVQKKLRK